MTFKKLTRFIWNEMLKLASFPRECCMKSSCIFKIVVVSVSVVEVVCSWKDRGPAAVCRSSVDSSLRRLTGRRAAAVLNLAGRARRRPCTAVLPVPIRQRRRHRNQVGDIVRIRTALCMLRLLLLPLVRCVAVTASALLHLITA